MRRGLALPCMLLIVAAAPKLWGGESLAISKSKLPSVFRPSRTNRAKADAPIFGLISAEPSRGYVVRFVSLESDDATDEVGDENTSGTVHIRSLPEEDPDQYRTIQSSDASPLKEAVPLDGVLRDDLSDDDDDPASALPSTRTSFGWIAGTNDQFGMLELESEPLSRVVYDPDHQPVFIGTSYGARWLSGPDITDMPPQLFNILINVGTAFQFNDRIKIDAMLSPGWYTDFSNKGVEAFRLPWHLVSFFQTDSNWQWVLGVTDLARDDIRYLPVVGMIYSSPESSVRLDLVFPRPRVAMKVSETPRETQ